MIIRADTGRAPTPKEIVNAISEYQTDWVPSIDALQKLYLTGDNLDSMYRMGVVDVKQKKLFFPIARYIAKILSNYTLGEAPIYTLYDDGGEIVGAQGALDTITRLYRKQSKRKTDKDIKLEAGKCGFAYEITYVDPKTLEPKSRLLPTESTFVVFSDEVIDDSLWACTWIKLADNSYKIHIYTKDESIVYEASMLSSFGTFREIDRQRHYIGRVPVTLYKNNRDMLGDYESVRVLIETYNEAMTDVKFDIHRAVTGLLVFYNTQLAGKKAEEKAEIREALKTLGVLELSGDPDNPQLPVDVKTLDSNLNIANADVFIDRLWKTIFKLSNVPDPMQSEYFTAVSGVALKMQQFLGLDQAAKDTAAEFDFALKRRFKMYNTILNIRGQAPLIDVGDVEIEFKLTAPQNDLEVAQMISLLYGKSIVTAESLAGQLSFVRDPNKEVEEAQAQNNANSTSNILRQLSAFGTMSEPQTTIAPQQEGGEAM